MHCTPGCHHNYVASVLRFGSTGNICATKAWSIVWVFLFCFSGLILTHANPLWKSRGTSGTTRNEDEEQKRRKRKKKSLIKQISIKVLWFCHTKKADNFPFLSRVGWEWRVEANEPVFEPSHVRDMYNALLPRLRHKSNLYRGRITSQISSLELEA